MEPRTLVTGYPRVGKKRELKKAIEKYWERKITYGELADTAEKLRKENWLSQKNKGVDLISCNDFSMYDLMLDTSVLLNAIPERFQHINNEVDRYFAMARGDQSLKAMDMTKWFNTNYHYIVPELNTKTEFKLNADKILSEYSEAKELGINAKINLIGPVTYLGLSNTDDNSDPYSYFDKVLNVYTELLTRLTNLNSKIYIQFEEPIFAKDTDSKQLQLLEKAYRKLSNISEKIQVIVTTYFDHSREAAEVLSNIPIWGIGLDFVYGKENIKSLNLLNDKMLIAGVVDGRNIWKNNLQNTLDLLNSINRKVSKEQIIISSNCSLQHVPYTIENEPESEVRQWLSFAQEKVDEISLLNRLFHNDASYADFLLLKKNTEAIENRKNSRLVNNKIVSDKLKSITKHERHGIFQERIQEQQSILNLPQLPTTTIGSFPQVLELRKLRRNYKKGIISEEEYKKSIKNYIKDCIEFQEKIGLDVFVHGEPERNDMVEYFGELLAGFHFTVNGWVQSYGTRCVKPPVIYGDISRDIPMTLEWIAYAQSLTDKPVKGMLTGPVTMLNWSFVRDDKTKSEVAEQLALAICEEIDDLQNAGIKIIQVDEAAFREGYPLREEKIRDYEKWAVQNFKFAVSSAWEETQIHTHMCYSDFNSIISTLEAMDADVLTVESARSRNTILKIFKENGYCNQIGPGVYDIHSPRTPSVNEFIEQITSRIEVLPISQLWINPDCGLKTRTWEEVETALLNMVRATDKIRVSCACQK